MVLGSKARRVAVAAIFTISGALASGTAVAADDPSIKGQIRADIQSSMSAFVDAQKTSDGSVVHYDPVDGKLLKLTLVALHEGIVKKGHFYVSCADFKSESGTLYDIDFLVVPAQDGMRVNQAIVHSVDGVKRKYHVEQRWPGLF